MRTRTPRRSRPVRSLRTQRHTRYFEFLESRLLFTTFASSDVAGTWNNFGTSVVGTAIYDDAGGLTGGSLTDDEGNNFPPVGTYSITSNGIFSLNAGGGNMPGAMSDTKDVLAISDVGADS